MAQVKKEVVLSITAKLEHEQSKLRFSIARRKREMKQLAHQQEVDKRELVALQELIRTLPKYKEK